MDLMAAKKGNKLFDELRERVRKMVRNSVDLERANRKNSRKYKQREKEVQFEGYASLGLGFRFGIRGGEREKLSAF